MKRLYHRIAGSWADFLWYALLAGILAYAIGLGIQGQRAGSTEVGRDTQGQPIDAFDLRQAHNQPYSTTQSELHNAFNALTRAVFVSCTSACYISQSTTPTTATACTDSSCSDVDFILPANIVVKLKVRNTSVSIRAVQVSASGTLSIVELE